MDWSRSGAARKRLKRDLCFCSSGSNVLATYGTEDFHWGSRWSLTVTDAEIDLDIEIVLDAIEAAQKTR